MGTTQDDYEDQIQAKKDLISEMDAKLVDYLFSNYEILMQEVQSEYIPKTPEEVKEVVDTIRKSSQDT